MVDSIERAVLARRIWQARKKANLTKAALARLAKINVSTLDRAECLKGRSYPSFFTVLKLAKTLEVSLDYLAGRVNKRGV